MKPGHCAVPQLPFPALSCPASFAASSFRNSSFGHSALYRLVTQTPVLDFQLQRCIRPVELIHAHLASKVFVKLVENLLWRAVLLRLRATSTELQVLQHVIAGSCMTLHLRNLPRQSFELRLQHSDRADLRSEAQLRSPRQNTSETRRHKLLPCQLK